MIRFMATSDTKSQARLNSIGYIIYLAANYGAKETLNQVETEGRLVLEGAEDDHAISKLTKTIIYLFATESAT